MNLRPHTPSGAGRTLRLALASTATVATLLLVPAAAGAQTYGTTPPPVGPSVLPNTGVNPDAPAAVAVPAAVRTSVSSGSTSRGSLAVTGGDVAGLAALGGTAVAAGAGLVLATRRRRATA